MPCTRHRRRPSRRTSTSSQSGPNTFTEAGRPSVPVSPLSGSWLPWTMKVWIPAASSRASSRAQREPRAHRAVLHVEEIAGEQQEGHALAKAQVDDARVSARKVESWKRPSSGP